MPREYVLRRRVQFAETDAAGIVHFAVFFRYMEEAEHAMWRDAGLSIAPPGSPIGWPRVAATFEFRRPLAFEDECDVRITVAEIGSRTITYTCAVTHRGQEIGRGTMKIACVRKTPGEPMQAVEIPGDVVARLS